MSPPRTSRHDRLGAPQLAFVRAWAEGLDVVLAWNRYLNSDGLGEPRRARAELRRLLDRLQALARAHGRPDLAALLGRDPEAITDQAGAPPSLEAFRLAQPADFYSEAELLALYQDTHGRADARSAARRRQRLRARQLAALQWLEGVADRPPQPEDAVAQWLAPALAGRLAVVGVLRLGELVYWIGRHGHHWHRPVPRLGPAGAGRVGAWLQQHQGSLGALPAWALAPRRQLDTQALTPPPQAGIVPLERLALPAALDGRQGSNRASTHRCQLRAADGGQPDDRDAVLAWLHRWPAGSHTWRAYRREAERLLLWAVVARGKPLSALDEADCADYLRFLAQPPALWTAPRNTQRWQTAWRPFEGPLSPASVRTARVILCNLGRWLLNQGWWASNPWEAGRAAGAPATATISTPSPVPPGMGTPGQPTVAAAAPMSSVSNSAEARPLRALSAPQWAHVARWLDAQPPSPAQRRLRLLLLLLVTAGLRLSEVCTASLSWLSSDPASDPGHSPEALPDAARPCVLSVPGIAARRITLPPQTVQALRDALADRAAAWPSAEAHNPSPLVARLDGTGPLSAARIRAVLAQAFAQCAQDLLRRDAAAAEVIRHATAGWLRHTWAVDAAQAGLAADHLQQALGHRSLNATAVYLAAARRRQTAA